MNHQEKSIKYSVVLPVYNSAAVVGETIDRTVAFFEGHGWDYELVLVNDGSHDQSWDVLCEKAPANPHIIAINLLRNYGQHTALFCGFQRSTGDYLITIDDDLQNPPEEIIHLINKAREGHDLVFGRFREKKHDWYRRLGSLLIRAINRGVFHQPKGLVLTNFRIIRRDVVDRICAYRTSYPYITGLAVMFSVNPANVGVEHQSRSVGKSNYNLFKIIELVMRILFNYSSFPLRLVSIVGVVISALSLLRGLYYLGKAIFIGVSVPGWTTVVVLLSFFNGITIFILSMLGEYTVRLLNQTSSSESYHVKEIIGPDV
jgi:glycosyltransferase involved in cell wall biosynthesis